MKIKERMNLYICEYGCHNVTVDVDKGVTPFMIKCMRTADKDRPLDPSKSKDGVCIGTAKSSMYPKEIDDCYPYPVPKHEWYRPSQKQYEKLSKSEKEHVEKGGLLIRERTDRKPITYEEWDGSWDNFEMPNFEKSKKSKFGKNYFN